MASLMVDFIMSLDDLVDSRVFDGRLQLLEYVPRVLRGPPGLGG